MTESDEGTVADIEEYMGVVPDPSGDIEAGRTVSTPLTKTFLIF